MSDQWYHAAFGQEFGPFSEEDLARMLVSGELTADDSVREGSVGPWVAARSVRFLMDSAASLAAETAEVATDIDSFMLVDERVAPPPPAPVRPQAAQPTAAQPVPRATTAHCDWYFQAFGEILGPVTLEALAAMVQRGEIAASDAIRRGTIGDWLVAGNDPVLFPQSSARRATAPSSRFETPSGTAPRAVPQQPVRATAPTRNLAAPPTPVAPVTDLDINWYCYINEQELGPMGTTELLGLAASGHVTAEVYVKYGPQGEWGLASQIPNLLPATAYSPAQPAAAVPLAPATPPAGVQADDERSELLNQLLSLLKKEGLSNELLGTINTAAPHAGTGWYCNISGAVMGPVTIEALVQMVLQKRIFPGDLIRLGNSGEWFPASTVPDLFPDTSLKAKGKKSGLDDSQHVMDRIDQIYREAQQAQEAKAKTDAETKAQPVGAAGSSPAKSNPANDILRNMNANIIRANIESNTPQKSSYSGKAPATGTPYAPSRPSAPSRPATSMQLPNVKIGAREIGIVAVIGLVVAGYFLAPTLLGDFAASRGFDELMAVNGKIINAQDDAIDPATWDKTSKPLLEAVNKVSKDLGVAKQGTSRRDVSRMAGYLKKMVETAAIKPVLGQEDEFVRNKKLFDDYTQAAMKKLRKK